MTMTAESPTEADENGVVDLTSRPDRSGRSKPSLAYAAKLARKELWRRRWRAVLVVLLIALPTLIMITMVTYVRATDEQLNSSGRDFSSDLVIPFVHAERPDSERSIAASYYQNDYFGDGSSRTAAEVEAVLPDGSTVQPVIEGYTSIMTDDGDIEFADFVKIDLASEAAKSWAPLSEGRAARSGEVVLGDDLASRLGVGVGDTVVLREPSGSWAVSGIASSDINTLSMFAVSDFDESQLLASSDLLLVNLPQNTGIEEANALADELGGWTPTNSRFSTAERFYDDGVEAVAITWLLAVIVFIMFGVVIVAAFATIARGQLVTVGQLAANGAKGPFIARVLALQGSWAGLAGVILGAVATIVAVALFELLIQELPGFPVDRLEPRPIDFLVVGLIGVAVATAAAAVPSLSLIRVSVLDALAGRRPERPVPTWMVPVGVAAFGLGLLLLTVSVTASTNEAAVGSILGALAMVIGACLVGPLAVQVASRAAPVMPLSVRISLRGLGRARLRSAAVVSSIAVTAGVMAVVVAAAQSETQGPGPGEIAENVALVQAYPSVIMRTPNGEALLDDAGMPLADLPDDIDTVELRWVAADSAAQLDHVRDVLPDATEHPVRAAVRPDGLYDNGDGAFIPKVQAIEPNFNYGTAWSAEFNSLPLIADDQTLAAFSLPSTFHRDLEAVGYARVVSGRRCPFDSGYWGESLPTRSVEPDGFEAGEIATIAVDGLGCWQSVSPFMTEQYAIDHGYQIEPAGALFTNPHPLSDAARIDIAGDYTRPSIFVDWDYAGVATQNPIPAASSSVVANTYSPVSGGTLVYYPSLDASDFALVQLIVGIGAVVVVSVITGIGLALAASDSRRDRAVLSVIGAKPKTQRRVAATDALVLVVIGTVLGVPAALFAARVVTASSYQGNPTGVPWPFVAAEFVLVPLVVAGFAYVAGWVRRPTPPMRVLHTD